MGSLRAGKGSHPSMKTGPFLRSLGLRSLYFLPNLFGDGKELVDVAANGCCKVVIGSDDAHTMEWGVVAGHVFFGEAGDALPVHWVALAGEGGAPDEPEFDVEAPAFG